MGFAVYHTSKGKGSGGGLGNHIDRIKGKEHTYKNADLSKTHANKEYIEKYKTIALPQAVKKRLNEGYNAKRKIRTDAVKYITHIFSGSHKEMIEIFKDKKKTKEWLQKNYDFACKEFGKENILRFTLHLDEKTPHIHCITVPLTKDGRLSAKEVIGNRKDLEQRQDRYAELMKPLGLERGIKNTGRKHETAKEYRKRLENNNELSDLKPVKGLLGIDYKKTSAILFNELKKAKNIISDRNLNVDRLEKVVKSIDYDRDKITSLKNNLRKERDTYKDKFQYHRDILVDVLKYNDKLKEIRQANDIVPEEKKPGKRQEKKQEKTRRKDKGFNR